MDDNFKETFIAMPSNVDEVVSRAVNGDYVFWGRDNDTVITLQLWKSVIFYAKRRKVMWYGAEEEQMFSCNVDDTLLEDLGEYMYTYYRYMDGKGKHAPSGEQCEDAGEYILKIYDTLYNQVKSNPSAKQIYAHVYFEYELYKRFKALQEKYQVFDASYDKPTDRYYSVTEVGAFRLNKTLDNEQLRIKLYDKCEDVVKPFTIKEAVELFVSGYHINGLKLGGFENEELSFTQSYWKPLLKGSDVSQVVTQPTLKVVAKKKVEYTEPYEKTTLIINELDENEYLKSMFNGFDESVFDYVDKYIVASVVGEQTTNFVTPVYKITDKVLTDWFGVQHLNLKNITLIDFIRAESGYFNTSDIEAHIIKYLESYAQKCISEDRNFVIYTPPTVMLDDDLKDSQFKLIYRGSVNLYIYQKEVNQESVNSF